MSERFYISCAISPGPFHLDGAEAHHLSSVCRLRPGDQVLLFNGDGREYPARIEAVQKRGVDLEVAEASCPERELPFYLEVAAPLPKGDRGQFLVEKLTELGVSRYVPLRTQRSVVNPSDHKLEKLRRYVIEASKQCGRNVLMDVTEVTPWETHVRAGDLGELRLIAHPGDGRDLRSFVGPRVRVAVGPEGGFTDEEVSKALAAGWTPIGLGPRILRVETAATTLASVLSTP